jgi:hypothetical protein
MAKLLLFPLLLAAGCVVSGLYGALHNQISYTVSPDYFHGFKFHQFGIPAELHNRLGAALVGWHASWWMGLIIGIPVLLVGLILPSWRVYLSRCLLAFGIIAATALVVGLAALIYASFDITETAFDRAGTMHNFSYLGGFLGIITGSLFLVSERVRIASGAAKALPLTSPASGRWPARRSRRYPC